MLCSTYLFVFSLNNMEIDAIRSTDEMPVPHIYIIYVSVFLHVCAYVCEYVTVLY